MAPERADEASLVQELRTSRFWKYIDDYLRTRIEALYAEKLDHADAILKNRGAVEEIQKMRALPGQVAALYRMDEARAEQLGQEAPRVTDLFGHAEATH